MEVHLKHMKDAVIGAPISEEDQVVTLLGSLPTSYSTLGTALEVRVDDVRLNFVQQALIHEEMKRSGQFGNSKGASSGDPADSALLGMQGRAWPRKPIKCFGCGKWDIFAMIAPRITRDCPENNPDGSKPVHKAKIVEEKCSDSDSDGVLRHELARWIPLGWGSGWWILECRAT